MNLQCNIFGEHGADLLEHPPGRLVGNAKFSLNCLAEIPHLVDAIRHIA